MTLHQFLRGAALGLVVLANLPGHSLAQVQTPEPQAAMPQLSLPASAPSGTQTAPDLIGDLLNTGIAEGQANLPLAAWTLVARMYHQGNRGVGSRDSLGCQVVPLRTVAIDPKLVPRRSVLFIPQTVGLPLPGGGSHDGYWYASDIGGGIKGAMIDLFTGKGGRSMAPLMKQGLNLAPLTTTKVGEFKGCPPAWPSAKQ